MNRKGYEATVTATRYSCCGVLYRRMYLNIVLSIERRPADLRRTATMRQAA
jgi:hypothetical protein